MKQRPLDEWSTLRSHLIQLDNASLFFLFNSTTCSLTSCRPIHILLLPLLVTIRRPLRTTLKKRVVCFNFPTDADRQLHQQQLDQAINHFIEYALVDTRLQWWSWSMAGLLGSLASFAAFIAGADEGDLFTAGLSTSGITLYFGRMAREAILGEFRRSIEHGEKRANNSARDVAQTVTPAHTVANGFFAFIQRRPIDISSAKPPSAEALPLRCIGIYRKTPSQRAYSIVTSASAMRIYRAASYLTRDGNTWKLEQNASRLKSRYFRDMQKRDPSKKLLLNTW